MAVRFATSAILILLAWSLGGTSGARILGIIPMPIRSHMITSSSLLMELAKRGHQVTAFSPYPENKEIPNYTEVKFNMTIPDLLKGTGISDYLNMDRYPFYMVPFILWDAGCNLCENVFQHEYIQKLIHSDEEKFDLLIVGAHINDCVLALAHKLNVPVVQHCSYGGGKWMDAWVGNPGPYSYVPAPFLSYSDKMNYWERAHNTIMEIYMMLGRKLYYLPRQDVIIKKYLNHITNMPSLSELETTKTALLLLNHHFSIDYPKPLLPNVVQVGGMHVKPPKKLPADIQKYIDDSPDGVILFSMGSNLRSSTFPEHKQKAFLEAFSKLKQRVLWKWETETLPGQPKNVKLSPWLPQSDILAHPNVRVFMTHGGLLSTEETISRGVPVVGIPVYGDQSLNMARAERTGIGLKVAFNNVTTESVSWALNEVLENPRYRENVQRMSRLYKDQPLTPLEQAVFWTEYVIRHKGAPHLRSAVMDLSWYQYFLLDIIAGFLLVIGSVAFVLYLLLRTILRKVFGSSQRHPTSSKKNN